jgi:hypothetical protein
MICAIPAGKWRLCLVKQNESKALQPRVDEIVRQVKLTMALKETLAARRIQTAWRSRSVVDEDEDYDDGNQPPRAKDIARRTHDDGFDEYDGEDECEESDSQAAERRQEIAGTAERQMDDWRDRSGAYLTYEQFLERQGETNGECCDGICCECDHGRWAEQVDPWGRTFGQAWKEFGAGIERENERVRKEAEDARKKAEQQAEEAEDARREAEYSQFPGLAAFIKSCGEPCKMVMDPKLEESLNRSVFEHNSVPTSSPHVRVSHDVSHTLPDNWQDIVTRGTN